MGTYELTFSLPENTTEEDVRRWGLAVKALHELFWEDKHGRFCIAEGNIHALRMLEGSRGPGLEA